MTREGSRVAVLRACDEWTAAAYNGIQALVSVDEGCVTAVDRLRVDIDRLTAATSELRDLIIGAHGLAAPQITPITNLAEHLLLCGREGRATSTEEVLCLRGLADQAVGQVRAFHTGARGRRAGEAPAGAKRQDRRVLEQEAIDLLEAGKLSEVAIAKQIGVNRTTLRDWARYAKAKADLKQKRDEEKYYRQKSRAAAD